MVINLTKYCKIMSKNINFGKNSELVYGVESPPTKKKCKRYSYICVYVGKREEICKSVH